jgi:hypothetical protein
MDMTPICDKCGKVAPIDEKMSTPDWVVYCVKEPCKCGGKFMAKFILDSKRRKERQ